LGGKFVSRRRVPSTTKELQPAQSTTV